VTHQELHKSSLREGAKALITERIVTGVYAPGDRIVESRIARELGVSQAPVREALRELATIGLVDAVANRGVVVREIDADELGSAFVIRAAIEELAVRRVAREGGDKVIPLLEAEIRAMRSAHVDQDVAAHASHSAEFHRTIIRASENRLLLWVWEAMSFHTRTLITHVHNDIDMKSNADAHQVIVEAIRAGDEASAGDLMRSHVESYAELPST
jgi:DNA-binding GntR family transcriptional regulator